jgi:ABC-type uncharacterized transport system substrate-binding protein
LSEASERINRPHKARIIHREWLADPLKLPLIARTTATIPIVFETAGDPVKLGLVASLNRPGGNVTGVTQLSSELVAKRLGLLHDLIPTATLIGLLVNPTDPRTETQTRDMQEAAHALGLQIHILNASTEGEFKQRLRCCPNSE